MRSQTTTPDPKPYLNPKFIINMVLIALYNYNF